MAEVADLGAVVVEVACLAATVSAGLTAVLAASDLAPSAGGFAGYFSAEVAASFSDLSSNYYSLSFDSAGLEAGSEAVAFLASAAGSFLASAGFSSLVFGASAEAVPSLDLVESLVFYASPTSAATLGEVAFSFSSFLAPSFLAYGSLAAGFFSPLPSSFLPAPSLPSASAGFYFFSSPFDYYSAGFLSLLAASFLAF